MRKAFMDQNSMKQTALMLILSKRDWLIEDTMELALWPTKGANITTNGKCSVPRFPGSDQNAISSV